MCLKRICFILWMTVFNVIIAHPMSPSPPLKCRDTTVEASKTCTEKPLQIIESVANIVACNEHCLTNQKCQRYNILIIIYITKGLTLLMNYSNL